MGQQQRITTNNHVHAVHDHARLMGRYPVAETMTDLEVEVLRSLFKLESEQRAEADAKIVEMVNRLTDLTGKLMDRITELERKSKWPF